MGSNMSENGSQSAANTHTTTNQTSHSVDSQEQEVPEFNEFKYRLNDDADADEVEDIFCYTPGGYHPVALGDALGDGGRFRVYHKLGFGGYATVWLCHDNISKKWRAVKIMTADSSTPDCAELKALRLFNGIDPDVLAANRLQLALEHFWIDGPNGRHLCFVLPFLGPKLSTTYSTYGHVPELMKDICFQLVEALKFLHSHRLCHGDFRTDNLLFRLADGVDEWDEEAVMKLLGKPDLARVEHMDGAETKFEPGVPAYLVERAHIAYGSGVCSSQIAVIDFGVSYRASQPPIYKGTGIPLPFASPEDIFRRDGDLGFHTDIWALGVAIAKVRCGFTPFADEQHDTLLEGLGKMECVMGPMPEPYRSIWNKWGGVFVNCQDENHGTREDGCWKDESVLATVYTDKEECARRSRIKEGRSPNYLHYRLQTGDMMQIDEEEAADIAAQAAANSHRLPAYTWGEDSRQLKYEEQIQYTMTDVEIKQMFDLFLKMFQWHPEQRATLDQVANHEWFGGRSRPQLATPSTPKPNNNKRAQAVGSGNGKESVWRGWRLYWEQIGQGLQKGAGRTLKFMATIGKTVSEAIVAATRRYRKIGRWGN
ncbi:kinase-like domain-containing protein [Chaetomidium leptoderma]|uniref:EKC/KEOPS complex subunit BUD32 n=1 Tax=Chaetomidium leptoderma TaxID=669021 RepID=A0AAN6VQA2_9PEZI|nr:kinase-like domain-containing protein [Chaetomidium leptoderma]